MSTDLIDRLLLPISGTIGFPVLIPAVTGTPNPDSLSDDWLVMQSLRTARLIMGLLSVCHSCGSIVLVGSRLVVSIWCSVCIVCQPTTHCTARHGFLTSRNRRLVSQGREGLRMATTSRLTTCSMTHANQRAATRPGQCSPQPRFLHLRPSCARDVKATASQVSKSIYRSCGCQWLGLRRVELRDSVLLRTRQRGPLSVRDGKQQAS